MLESCSTSLVFDLEEEMQERRLPDGSSRSLKPTALAPSTSSGDLSILTRPRSPAETKLVVDVASVMSQLGDVLAVESLARALRSMGYWTLIRTALGGERGFSTMTNLKHTFLLCMLPGMSISQLFVVDPNFRDSFHIALPTPRYAALLAAVPPVFVGTPEYLSALVPLLCAEMEHAFLTRGATLPPWRQASSMLARWHSKRIVDVAVSSRGQLMEVQPAAVQQAAKLKQTQGDVITRSLGQTAIPGGTSGTAPGGTSGTGKGAPAARRCSWVMPQGAPVMMSAAAGPRFPGNLERRRSDLSSQLERTRRSDLTTQLERSCSDVASRRQEDTHHPLRAFQMANDARLDGTNRRPLGSASFN